MSMPDFQHVILTRFNVREQPDDTRLISDTAWLEERYRLFDEFCFPSVASQSCKEFRWLVFFDSATPESFRQKNDDYVRYLPQMEPVYIHEFSKNTIASILEKKGSCSSPHLITTRLDNDDGICTNFVAHVQNEFRYQHAEVINFTNGLIWYKGRLYNHKDPSNAFTSLIEKSDNIQTVLARWHTKLAEIAPLRQVDSEPAWLQVVHGNNRKNRVRGRRTNNASLQRDFVLGKILPATGKHGLDYITDKLAMDHLRAIRELVILGLKALRKS